MADGNYDVLKLEIDHIKNNIRELEADRKIMMKTNQTLSENVVRITTLLENQATNINELEKLRQQADELNLQILKLINERGNIVKEIGKAKEAQGVNR
ncbi:chorismate mutase, partial [Bacillus safensis]|uniref:chorismate mutase n=1 Tax=Bacillus safensis TaxID=561879 RepID=UPI003396B282